VWRRGTTGLSELAVHLGGSGGGVVREGGRNRAWSSRERTAESAKQTHSEATLVTRRDAGDALTLAFHMCTRRARRGRLTLTGGDESRHLWRLEAKTNNRKEGPAAQEINVE